MRESFGHAFIFNMVIVFISIILLLLVGSLSYSKAFKIKNQIIEIIEKNNGYNQNARDEIDYLLSKMGYKINTYGKQTCSTSSGGIAINEYATNYRYCVVQYGDGSERGIYYGVTTYIYFEIPLINSLLEFPIYGESKTFYNMTY